MGIVQSARAECARQIRHAMQLLARYVDSEVPLVRANNALALLIAMSQPFYPIYVRLVTGHDASAVFLTLLTTPFFCCVPALSRHSKTWSLAAVPFIGLVNAAIATKVLGAEAGIELFVVPCLLVAFFVCDHTNRIVVVPTAIIALVIFSLVYCFSGSPLVSLPDDAYPALFRLNAFSVVFLSIYIVVTFGRARRIYQSRKT